MRAAFIELWQDEQFVRDYSNIIKTPPVLVTGEEDYDYNEAGSCYVDKRCTNDGCRGESSTRVSYAAAEEALGAPEKTSTPGVV